MIKFNRFKNEVQANLYFLSHFKKVFRNDYYYEERRGDERQQVFFIKEKKITILFPTNQL